MSLELIDIGVPVLPDLPRRGFLQLVGAAGLTPFLPAIPAKAAVTSGASVSKALWAGMYANSGSTAGFVSMAKNMGLSNTAIQGISARSVGVRMSLVAAEKLTSAGAKPLPSRASSKENISSVRDTIERTFDRRIDRHSGDETDEPIETDGHDADEANENEREI